MWRSTARLFIVAILFLPPILLLSTALAKWLFWAIIVLFLAWIGGLIRRALREAPLRKARIEAILARKPAYVAYGSGTPRWLAAPIYISFGIAGLALLFWEAVTHPGRLTGFNGFLTVMMMHWVLPFSVLSATAAYKALAWHLRNRFRDKVLVFADDTGIGTVDGPVMPYASIRRIDPCSWRSKFGHDDWIEVAGDFGSRRIPVNMSIEPPDEILQQLRDRAQAAGANLAPAFANGRAPRGGSQLGYRMGY